MNTLEDAQQNGTALTLSRNLDDLGQAGVAVELTHTELAEQGICIEDALSVEDAVAASFDDDRE